MKKVVVTVGTSLFENYKDPDKNSHINSTVKSYINDCQDEPAGKYNTLSSEINMIKTNVFAWAKNNEDASAEINSLVKMQEELQDNLDAYLLCTDTILSVVAAELIQEWFQNSQGGYPIKIIYNNRDYISKLQVERRDDLMKEGLPSLLERIRSIALEKKPKGWEDVLFNITGGYKVIIPYLTFMATVNNCKTFYIFEGGDQELITVPPFPFKMDMDLFSKYEKQIEKLASGIQHYRDYEKELNEYRALEEKGLIYECEGEDSAELSVIGKIYYGKIQENYLEYYYPISIWDKVQLHTNIKWEICFKFSDKQQRESRTVKKSYGQTKEQHLVYENSDNKIMIFYFIAEGKIYIYEVFDEYEEFLKYLKKNPFNDENKKDIMEKAFYGYLGGKQ
jgi:CRISPR/Cas system-associated protein Csm6